MTRSEILNAAEECVCGARDIQYGSPERNFETIALLWSVYLSAASTEDAGGINVVTPKDVAAMLALLKVARIASGNPKEDNWIDLAGYAACGGELESGGL